MDVAALLPLLENGLLLLALVLVYDILVVPVERQPNRWAELLLGVSIGGIGMIVVLTPWRNAPGVSFDTRSVLLSLPCRQPGLQAVDRAARRLAGWAHRTHGAPNQRGVLELLERWHYRVHAVANGQEAFAYIAANLHAVEPILSDVVLPELSGLTQWRTLRQRQIAIPLILMTGHLQGEELEYLRQFGLSAWLAKPPGIDQLARTIAEVLAIQKAAS